MPSNPTPSHSASQDEPLVHALTLRYTAVASTSSAAGHVYIACRRGDGVHVLLRLDGLGTSDDSTVFTFAPDTIPSAIGHSPVSDVLVVGCLMGACRAPGLRSDASQTGMCCTW